MRWFQTPVLCAPGGRLLARCASCAAPPPPKTSGRTQPPHSVLAASDHASTSPPTHNPAHTHTHTHTPCTMAAFTSTLVGTPAIAPARAALTTRARSSVAARAVLARPAPKVSILWCGRVVGGSPTEGLLHAWRDRGCTTQPLDPAASISPAARMQGLGSTAWAGGAMTTLPRGPAPAAMRSPRQRFDPPPPTRADRPCYP